MNRLAVAAVSMVVALPAMAPAAVATAERDECVQRLLEAPVESAALPDGWEWAGLALGEYYWPTLPSPTALFGQLRRAEGDDMEADLWLMLACQPNADLVLERIAEVGMLPLSAALGVVPVGDGSIGPFRIDSEGESPVVDLSGAPTLLWRDGDVLGRVVGMGDEAGTESLEAIASSISDVLGASGSRGPITDDDACVRRILATPIETLDDGMALHVFPTVTPTWATVMPGSLPWSTPYFFLSCRPDAALLMERAAAVAERSWALDFDGWAARLDIDPIGDGALAFELFEVDEGRSEGITLLWRVGDALGEINTDAGSLEAAQTFARRVSDLLTVDGTVPSMSQTPRGQACVRRLLGAPVETLGAWIERDPWYNLSLGRTQVSATWVGSPHFELSCQSNAALIMQRAVELAMRDDGEVIDVAPIGDAAVAAGDRRWPTLWWRNGDVLGKAYAGKPLAGLEKLAQRVDALLD